MEINKIYNEDCIETMRKMDDRCVDVVLTSPFYNTNKKCGKTRTLLNTKVKQKNYEYLRYDQFIDNMTNEQYCDFTVNLFNNYDKVLKKNGVVLYNISYGSENTDCMFLTISDILKRTNFTIADVICWKKKTALPNSSSPNKLTRIFEFVFVLVRKEDFMTFYCNKKVKSVRDSGQKMYENIYNFIEAPNNDGSCPYNKATFSSELVVKLLTLYCPQNGLVYDSFMGSGTTAVGAIKYGANYIGSEISKNQVEFARKRIESEKAQLNLFSYA